MTESKSYVYVTVETVPTNPDKARGTGSTSMAVTLDHNVLAQVKCFTPLLDIGAKKIEIFPPSIPTLE